MAKILALGGGGLLDERDARLQRYLLSQTGRARPKVCFVATGKGDDATLIESFYAAFARHDCEPRHLALFKREVRDLERFVLGQDLVFVWGGNTASMLAVWQAHGLDPVLREAASRGIVLAGACAGALAWFENGVTDSFGGLDPVGGGLGLLPGSCCPYYDADPERRPAYHRLVEAGALEGGYAIDVDVSVRFEGGELTEVVTSREGASAWRVERNAGEVVETRLAPTLLPDDAR